MRRRLLLLVVGCAVGLSGGGTYAAFSNQATNPSNTIASHPDFLAPPLTNHAFVKTSGGIANFVRPNGTFRVCANVGADPGNPATLLKDVLTDLGGLSTVTLAPGSTAPCGAGHNYQSASMTATISVPVGQTSTVNVVTTVRDNGLNANTDSIPVVIDNDAPAVADVTTTNGGTVNKPDAGDVIIFTFDEPIDPDSIADGWDGSQRAITVTAATAGGGKDRLTFGLPIAGGGLTINNDYIANNFTFGASTIEAAGSPLGTQYRVTLGTIPSSTATTARTTTDALQWATTTALWDRAGNAVPAGTFTETSVDTDF